MSRCRGTRLRGVSLVDSLVVIALATIAIVVALSLGGALRGVAAGAASAGVAVADVAIEAPAEPAEPDEPWFFVVGADPQLLFNQKDDRNWRTTIDHVNRLRPDFMIVCGDLVQAPNEADKWLDPDNVAEYDKLAAMYNAGAARLDRGIALYNVAGNHDVSLAPTPTTLAWYEDRFGAKPWYRFEHKRSLFVVLESNLIRDGSGAPDHAAAQERFIDETLALARRGDFAHRTLYMHHPMCLQSVDEADQYFNIPKAKRTDLIARLKGAGFNAVFCGHYHRNAYVKTGDLELVTTASCGAALGDDPLGFRIVKVFADRLEHAYVPFEKMPDRVDLDAGAAAPAAGPTQRRAQN